MKTRHVVAAATVGLLGILAWQLCGLNPSAVPFATSSAPSELPSEGSVAGPGQFREQLLPNGRELAIASELIERLLFEDFPDETTRLLESGIAEGRIDRDHACKICLRRLGEDVVVPEARLENVASTARFLRLTKHPPQEVERLAIAYKSTAARPVRHRSLQELLRGWPCHDGASCARSLEAELLAETDPRALDGLIRLAWKEGGQSRATVLRFVTALSWEAPLRRNLLEVSVQSIAAAAATVPEAVDGFAEIAMMQMDRFYSSVRESDRGQLTATGAIHPSLEALINALGFLEHARPGTLAQEAGLTPERCQALLLAMTKSVTTRGHGQAVELLTVNLLSGRSDPWAVDFVRRYAERGPSLTLRLSALAQLGRTQSVDVIEETMIGAVTAEPGLLSDTRFQVAYLAAVDNSSHRDSNSADAARRVFSEVLLGTKCPSVDCVSFVLSAIGRNRVPGYRFIVSNIALGDPRPSVRALAQETLSLLPDQ